MNGPPPIPQGLELAERTQPLAPDDEAQNWAHLILTNALAVQLQQVYEIADPEAPIPPLAPLLDPDLCPAWALPWLAQFVGVSIPAGVSEEDARVLVKSVSGWSRGTPAALRAAAGLYLTGTKTVYFRERDPTGTDPPYTLEVVTLDDETADPEKVRAALMAAKPGGIVLHYREVQGWDYEELAANGPDPYSGLAAEFDTYYDLANNDPS